MTLTEKKTQYKKNKLIEHIDQYESTKKEILHTNQQQSFIADKFYTNPNTQEIDISDFNLDTIELLV